MNRFHRFVNVYKLVFIQKEKVMHIQILVNIICLAIYPCWPQLQWFSHMYNDITASGNVIKFFPVFFTKLQSRTVYYTKLSVLMMCIALFVQ